MTPCQLQIHSGRLYNGCTSEVVQSMAALPSPRHVHTATDLRSACDMVRPEQQKRERLRTSHPAPVEEGTFARHQIAHITA